MWAKVNGTCNRIPSWTYISFINLFFTQLQKKMNFLKYTKLEYMKRPLLLVMRVAIFCSFKMSQVTTSISLLDTKRAKFVLTRSSPDYLYQKTLKISNLFPSQTTSVFYKGHLVIKSCSKVWKFKDTWPWSDNGRKNKQNWDKYH